MSLLSLRSVLVLAASGSLLAACGPAPKPVSEVDEYANSNPTPQQAPRALGPGETSMPAGHPPVGPDGGPAAGPAGGQESPTGVADGEVIWDGHVRLRGDLAADAKGFVFVNVKHPGVVIPGYSVKVAVTEGTSDGSDLLVPFALREGPGPVGNALGGLVPGAEEILLEAYTDDDGFVETKEGQVRHSIPIELGQKDLEIALGG